MEVARGLSAIQCQQALPQWPFCVASKGPGSDIPESLPPGGARWAGGGQDEARGEQP